MMNLQRARSTRANMLSALATSSVSTAVLVALYGMPPAAYADDSSDSQTPALQEVVVTADRRKETTEQVPYAISVITPSQIANTSVTDLDLLTREAGIAGGGTPQTAAFTFPIIRGLNASPSGAGFRMFEEAPVGTYIDNSPVDGYFQLEDMQRIEVLRGPQGTLYGAGALGGAIRVIPNAPELQHFSADVDGRVGSLDHAGTPTYTATGMINIPLGDTLAFRAAGNYEYVPGFIDAYGLMEQSGPLGIPVLANPSDPVNSSAVYTSKHDWNEVATLTARGSLLWKPVSSFSAELAFTYSHADGDANNSVNPLFAGGPSVIDPKINLPAGSNFTTYSSTDLPYYRRLALSSLDLSYDAGFATLSTTSTYYTNGGYFDLEPNIPLFQPTLIAYVPYYAGSPINPRWISPEVFSDSEHTFSQEVRLVSNTNPSDPIDYVVGVYYEKQTRLGGWTVSQPGSPERAVAEGCTSPVYYGSAFPSCLTLTGPNDISIDNTDTERFNDKSVYGELTYHFARNWQITAGFRHFQEDFSDAGVSTLYAFGLVQPPTSRAAKFSKTTGKVDISFEYAPGHHVYALWSQGFRRGGANGQLLTSGPFADEAPATYGPDTVNNYEFGIKGRFANGFSYTFDGFYIPWDNPQISGLTPDSNFSVWNAKKALSKGVEFTLNTPLGLRGLSLMLVGTYADAKLTADYSYPDYFGNISGKSGEQLPGSPKEQTAATLAYQRDLGDNYFLSTSLNDTYTSSVVTSYFAVLGIKPVSVPALNYLNASVSVSHGPWRIGLYGTNITNKYYILGQGAANPPMVYVQTINQPRVLYLRGGYSF